ncbi:MAG: hypothetical protein HOP13_12675 [Alphaproteobacteria bacterium]|nr:hypothetical protein [Alphaproteobacteria bacterium]
MIEIDEQTLMAFADGELDAAAAAEVRHALEHDAALQARLEKLNEADGQLRAAIAPGSDIPSRFAQLLKPAAPAFKLRHAWIPASAALAAALAIWVTSAVLTTPTAWIQQTDQGLAIAGPLADAAAKTPSGTTFEAGKLRIQPVVSFTADSGRPCRDLSLRDGERTARVIACREAQSGHWIVEAMASVPASDPGAYRTAGAPRNAIIGAALTSLGAVAPMDARQETDAIARNWAAK